jgi:8-oxoguanine deaminase
MITVSTKTAMAELMLSGCTTAMDHLYLYPNGIRLDDEIAAAEEIGMRFHASRGAMSLGVSKGGLPPDRLVEDEAAVLCEMRRLIEAYHDKSRYAMLRVVVAPCSPFTVSQDLMREAAALARAYGVSLHTHLAENDKDVAFTREMFGCTPAQYAEKLDWVGHDVWHAHCVKLDEHGIGLFGRTGTGVAHCPCSNMRLASGIAPVGRMRSAGVPVGLGVDGSASNDTSNLMAEARQAMLLARVGYGPDAMTARQALEIATLGGARVLGRDDIGSLGPDMAADFVAYDLRPRRLRRGAARSRRGAGVLRTWQRGAQRHQWARRRPRRRPDDDRPSSADRAPQSLGTRSRGRRKLTACLPRLQRDCAAAQHIAFTQPEKIPSNPLPNNRNAGEIRVQCSSKEPS